MVNDEVIRKILVPDSGAAVSAAGVEKVVKGL